VARRRRWRAEEKGRIVAQAVAPGAVVAEVARQHDLAPQQLSNWINAAKEGRIVLPAPEPDGEFGEVTDAAFVPVVAVQAYWTVQPMAGWLPSANLSESDRKSLTIPRSCSTLAMKIQLTGPACSQDRLSPVASNVSR
jgi:transposase-like protein